MINIQAYDSIDEIIDKCSKYLFVNIEDEDISKSDKEIEEDYFENKDENDEAEKKRRVKIELYNTLLLYAPDAIREEDIPDGIDD